MIAILIVKVTKYDCNDDDNGDQIWMQFLQKRGLYVIAYDLFQKGPYMIATSEFVLESRD